LKIHIEGKLRFFYFELHQHIFLGILVIIFIVMHIKLDVNGLKRVVVSGGLHWVLHTKCGFVSSVVYKF